MEVVGTILGVVILTAFLVGLMSSSQGDPRNHATGRWGIKIGKVARGEFGGEKWGEKPKQK